MELLDILDEHLAKVALEGSEKDQIIPVHILVKESAQNIIGWAIDDSESSIISAFADQTLGDDVLAFAPVDNGYVFEHDSIFYKVLKNQEHGWIFEEMIFIDNSFDVAQIAAALNINNYLIGLSKLCHEKTKEEISFAWVISQTKFMKTELGNATLKCMVLTWQSDKKMIKIENPNDYIFLPVLEKEIINRKDGIYQYVHRGDRMVIEKIADGFFPKPNVVS